jgi:SAM-dependent methyltransferase
MNFEIQHNHTIGFLDSFVSGPCIKDAKVLDVGCGDGFAAVQFLERGAMMADAFDPDPDCGLDESGYPPGLRETGVIFSKNWFDLGTAYDIVWCHHVAEHVEEPIAFLRKLGGLLAPGGWLWLTVPNMAGLDVYSPGHINSYIAPQLIQVLQIVGFAVGDAKVMAQRGQLRVRVTREGNHLLPPPMRTSLEATGRCQTAPLAGYRWRDVTGRG